ncbi:MAG: hypothetical protein NTX45_13385 [Proteobacteria bacterium]|nr:hypothetical protein [Pseudomonadota bacterium]
MNKFKSVILATVITFSTLIISPSAMGANVNFTGNVGIVEIRTPAWGSFLIITIIDNSGARVRLCGAAPDPTAIALPLSDPTAKNVQAIALAAKISGKKVTGWGIDQIQGQWCGIGNFVIL